MAQSIVLFLHNLFTVIWVGGLCMLAISIIPALKNKGSENENNMKLLTKITSRHRIWVFISIVGLFITGLMLGKSNNSSNGFMQFDTDYGIIASVKHILTFLMIIIAAIRLIMVSKKNNNGIPLIYVNFILGVIVLLLSAMMTTA